MTKKFAAASKWKRTSGRLLWQHALKLSVFLQYELFLRSNVFQGPLTEWRACCNIKDIRKVLKAVQVTPKHKRKSILQT